MLLGDALGLYTQIVENTPDPLLIVDRHYALRMVTAAQLRLLMRPR